MARNSQRGRRRDWRQNLLIAISIIIVISMALGLFLTFAPPPTN
jgi:hypothetical protein